MKKTGKFFAGMLFGLVVLAGISSVAQAHTRFNFSFGIGPPVVVAPYPYYAPYYGPYYGQSYYPAYPDPRYYYPYYPRVYHGPYYGPYYWRNHRGYDRYGHDWDRD